MSARNRVEVMHGVNLDQLGRRPAAVYGELTYDRLQQAVEGYARDLGLQVRFFQTNAEHQFVEHLHRLDGLSDAIVMNPGAWTHYAWAIRDALEIAADGKQSVGRRMLDGGKAEIARISAQPDHGRAVLVIPCSVLRRPAGVGRSDRRQGRISMSLLR